MDRFDEWWEIDGKFYDGIGVRDAAKCAWHARDTEIAELEQRVRLERVAAIRKAVESVETCPGETVHTRESDTLWILPQDVAARIRTLISPEDASLLDAQLQESRGQGWQEAIKLVETGTKSYVGKWPDRFREVLDAYVQEKVDAWRQLPAQGRRRIPDDKSGT